MDIIDLVNEVIERAYIKSQYAKEFWVAVNFAAQEVAYENVDAPNWTQLANMAFMKIGPIC